MGEKVEASPDKTYLSVQEACELAGISRSSFYRLLDAKDTGLHLIAHRIPGMQKLRIRREEFCAWLEGRA